MASFRLERQIVRSGFDGERFWAQARAGCLPGPAPVVVMTAQPCLRSGSDVFGALSEWRTADYGATWDGPLDHAATLGRRAEPGGVETGVCDMTPGWHAASGTLLSTGHTVSYRDDKHPITARRRATAWSVYDPATRTWSPWANLVLPDRPEYASSGSGSGQRYDLPDGTILLPIYHKPVSDDWHAIFSAAVVRCGFDGQTLTCLELGDSFSVAEPRGLCEPSLTRCRGRFYLTLRNDVRGYVAVSDDGLRYAPPVPWRFDDGEELGSYNTQQHWVVRGDDLFLVYTRRGLNNDHVFRHRAPLLIARVDPERLVVRRETEVEIVPNRGARLGNFAVTDVPGSAGRPDETWVTAAEWMQPVGCEQYGSDNTIWVARLIWE